MGIWRSASPVLHSRPLTSSKSSGFSVVKRSRTPNERVCGWMEDGQTLSLCSFCFDSLHDRQTQAGGHCWRASRRAVTFVCQNIKSMSASTIAVCYAGCTAAVQKKLQREIRSGEKQSLSLSLPLFLPARPYRHRVRKIIRNPFCPRLTCSAGFLLEGGAQNAIGAFMQGYSDEFCDLSLLLFWPANQPAKNQPDWDTWWGFLFRTCLSDTRHFIRMCKAGARLQAHNPESEP